MATGLGEFDAVFSQLVNDLQKQCPENYDLPTQILEWFEKSLIHGTIGGKCNRGLSVAGSERLLLDRDLAPDYYFNAAMLGWMIELWQAMMLVLDEIIDSSQTRRGKLCWYFVPNIAMAVVNGTTML